MSQKTSLDYTELAGLRIAYSRHLTVDITHQDEDWIAVANWLKVCIKELESK